MLSERPLSAATRWETEVYRSRGALRVVCVTKIRRCEGRKGVRGLPVTQRGLKFPRSMKQPPSSRARYTFYLVALLGRRWRRGGVSLCRERLCLFFTFHSFEIPLMARSRRSIVARVSRVPWEKTEEQESRLFIFCGDSFKILKRSLPISSNARRYDGGI